MRTAIPVGIASTLIASTLTALAATDPPQQTQAVQTHTQFPASYTLGRTYRMSKVTYFNVGTYWMTCQFIKNDDFSSVTPERAMMYIRDPEVNGSFEILKDFGFGNTTKVSPRCANQAGLVGGELNGNGFTNPVPTMWRLDDLNVAEQKGNGDDSGLFWDVNANNYFVGYWEDPNSHQKTAIWWVSNNPAPLVNGAYSGAEARGINVDRDIVGQAFGSTHSPPVVWKHLGGGSYQFIDLTNCNDWPLFRSSYLVGITSRRSGDTKAVKARFTVKLNSTYTSAWSCDFEQLKMFEKH